MKAIVVHQYGGPEVLKWEEYPDPVPGPGEVLVRIAAASVTPIDDKRRAGLTKEFYPQNASDYPSVKAVFVFSQFDRETLEFMAEAVRDGKLVIPIGQTLPLSEAAKAQATVEEGGVGKILLVA